MCVPTVSYSLEHMLDSYNQRYLHSYKPFQAVRPTPNHGKSRIPPQPPLRIQNRPRSIQNHPKMDSKRCVQIPLKQAIPDTPKMDFKNKPSGLPNDPLSFQNHHRVDPKRCVRLTLQQTTTTYIHQTRTTILLTLQSSCFRQKIDTIIAVRLLIWIRLSWIRLFCRGYWCKTLYQFQPT